MVRSATESGLVLIADNGYIRKDRAVPFILQHRIQQQVAQSLAIAITEVAAGQKEFADYGLFDNEESALYDFVLFTPKFDTTDHCAALREQFKNMKKTKP